MKSEANILDRGNVEVANTILQQMGGFGRIRMMTGVKLFVAHPDGVAFRFPNRRGPNHVDIRLTPDDEYVVTFARIAGGVVKVTEKHDGAHAEDLVRLFERATGLYLTLGKVVRA